MWGRRGGGGWVKLPRFDITLLNDMVSHKIIMRCWELCLNRSLYAQFFSVSNYYMTVKNNWNQYTAYLEWVTLRQPQLTSKIIIDKCADVIPCHIAYYLCF